jgi:hypothetical protein
MNFFIFGEKFKRGDAPQNYLFGYGTQINPDERRVNSMKGKTRLDSRF